MQILLSWEIYENLNQIDKAIFHYQKSLNNDKKLVEAYRNLALIFEQINQKDDAREVYEVAIKIIRIFQ